MNNSKPEQAVATFKQSLACSQAVLATFAPELGLERDTALKLAAGFGGGMGRMGNTCGAVTGAFMVIGLRHGGTSGQDLEAKTKTYATVREFVKQFQAKHGCIGCNELLGCDISTPEGYEKAKQSGAFANLCPQFVHTAAEILEALG